VIVSVSPSVPVAALTALTLGVSASKYCHVQLPLHVLSS
jgi:hypothetical protein